MPAADRPLAGKGRACGMEGSLQACVIWGHVNVEWVSGKGRRGRDVLGRKGGGSLPEKEMLD